MEKAKLLGQQSISDCQGWWLGGGDRLQGIQGNFGVGVMKIFYIFTVVVITQLDTFVKTQQTIYLKW